MGSTSHIWRTRSADHESIDHISAGLYENELSNAETGSPPMLWTALRYNISSQESNPPRNTAFVRTRLRTPKLNSQASSYLHLKIYSEALPISQSVIQLSTTTLVPVYAFAANRSESSGIYLSDSGMQPSLCYNFIRKEGFPRGSTPMGALRLQGALDSEVITAQQAHLDTVGGHQLRKARDSHVYRCRTTFQVPAQPFPIRYRT